MSWMTSREKHQADATHHAAAIARWDDEGGASTSPRRYTGADVSNDVSSKRLAESPADLKVDQTSGDCRRRSSFFGAGIVARFGGHNVSIRRCALRSDTPSV